MSAHKCQSIFPEQLQIISERNNVKIGSKYCEKKEDLQQFAIEFYRHLCFRNPFEKPHMQTSMPQKNNVQKTAQNKSIQLL